jgi:soluble lytic murein transglycosylase-like protein
MTADVLAFLTAAAAQYNVPLPLAIAVANQESGGNQYNSEGGVLTSPAGALGVMQLMPATAAGLGVDPTDTQQNVDGGVRYLAQLLTEFNGNQQLALAAYNWGPGNVSKNGLENWPTETVNYVSSILSAVGASIGGDSSDGSSASIVPGTSSMIAIAVAGALALLVFTEVLS